MTAFRCAFCLRQFPQSERAPGRAGECRECSRKRSRDYYRTVRAPRYREMRRHFEPHTLPDLAFCRPAGYAPTDGAHNWTWLEEVGR